MNNKLLLFLFVIFLFPVSTAGAEIRTIVTEIAFTASSDPGRQLLGYRLYGEGVQVCETINPEPLQAAISPASATGESPLRVSFLAIASTGNIFCYHWEFGDGTTATGATVSHIYTIAGTYTATLTIEDSEGATDQAVATITAQPTVTPSEPPTARLYSSKATGETISHTYSTAGTYHAELTVTDSQGLTDKIDTPIIVVGTAAPNEKPTAVISGDFSLGHAPLATSFDGSQSTDTDGTIAQYNWNFGDGTIGNGPTVQHTYVNAAIYTVSLQVTDNQGETATATREITCLTTPPEIIVNFEVGEGNLDYQWVKVLFENSFNQPVVIGGPPITVNDSQPVLTRIRNIDREGFEIRL